MDTRNLDEAETGAGIGARSQVFSGDISFFFTLFSLHLDAGSDQACGGKNEDPDTPTQSDSEDRDEEPMAPLANANEDLGSDLEASTGTTEPSLLILFFI